VSREGAALVVKTEPTPHVAAERGGVLVFVIRMVLYGTTRHLTLQGTRGVARTQAAAFGAMGFGLSVVSLALATLNDSIPEWWRALGRAAERMWDVKRSIEQQLW